MCPESINKGNRGSPRRERLRAKGGHRFDQLLVKVGGLMSLKDTAELLALSESAVIAKADRRELLSIRGADDQRAFPRFQFEKSREAPLLQGLLSFLAAVSDWDDATIIRFLLVRYDPQHSDETPLDLILRNQVNEALELAKHCYEQRP